MGVQNLSFILLRVTLAKLGTWNPELHSKAYLINVTYLLFTVAARNSNKYFTERRNIRGFDFNFTEYESFCEKLFFLKH
jgi:hypothetical protein